MAENQAKIKKQEVIKKLNASKNAIIVYNKNWRYPHNGDDQRSCKMLDLMLSTEYRSGIFVFIPDAVNKCKMVDRNKD